MAIKTGFYGAECYDMIHYLARILKCLGKRVLIIDSSQDRSLASTVSMPDKYHCGVAEIYDYRGVAFSETYLYQFDNEYEYILIYYGSVANRINRLDKLVLVYDGDIRRRKAIKSVLKNYERLQIEANEEKTLPLFVTIGVAAAQMVSMNTGLPDSCMEIIDVGETDIILKHYCQNSQTFIFSKLSDSYKDFLYKIITDMTGEKERDIKTAFKWAERGN